MKGIVVFVLCCAAAAPGAVFAKTLQCKYSEAKKYRKGGKLHGKMIPCLSESGVLVRKTSFNRGVEHGPYEEYTSDGTLIYKGNNKEGKRNGPQWHYWADGSPRWMTTFKDEVKHGLNREYCSPGSGEGRVEREGSYKEGVNRDGVWKEYDCRTGTLQKLSTWNKGVKEGTFEEHHYRSNKIYRRSTYKNNLQHGIARSWSPEGKLEQEQCWQHGRVEKDMGKCK